MEASLIRRSKGSLADKEQTVHGVAEPQLHAGRKPSPQPVLPVWLLHLTTGTVDGLAGAGFVSTYFAMGFANGDGGYWQGPSPTPLTPTPMTHFPGVGWAGWLGTGSIQPILGVGWVGRLWTGSFRPNVVLRSGKLQQIAPCGNHSNDNPAGLYIFRLVLGNNDK